MKAAREPAQAQPTAEPANHRFDSWKEIAAYLNREVRTVQRWEKAESLPIHRLQHDKRGSVFAFRSELDDWMVARERRGLDGNGSGQAALRILNWPAGETTEQAQPDSRRFHLPRAW